MIQCRAQKDSRMNEIISVNNETQTVDARQLHEMLEVKTAFKDWFPRMCEFGFEEGTDFSSKMSESTGGRPQKNYDVTLDMAKHICMVQRTEKSKVVRQYLIDLEKAWNTPEQVMARALQIANKKVEELQEKALHLIELNEEMKPKAEYFDNLVDRKLNTNIRNTAKELGVKEKDFTAFLVPKYCYRDSKQHINPRAEYMENGSGKGYFVVKEYTTEKHSGTQLLITPRGREAFRLLIGKGE